MGLAEHLAEHACAYNGCSQNAISLICASKESEEPVYSPSCGPHEPDIARDMKELYEPMGFIITILDIVGY